MSHGPGKRAFELAWDRETATLNAESRRSPSLGGPQTRAVSTQPDQIEPMKKLLILTVCVSLGVLFQARAQRTLADLVAEAGAEWMIGEWVGYTGNGEPMTQKVSWDLDKHVVSMHFQSPMFEIKSMTGLDPATGQARYVGFSNRGGALSGTWQEEAGWPMLRLQGTNADGQSWKMALVYRRVDENAMAVEIYGLDDADHLIRPARNITEFKRRENQPGN